MAEALGVDRKREEQTDWDDGFLNNGFDPDVFTGVGSIGFEAKNVELPAEDIYSGYNLQRSQKGNLDTQ